MIPIRKTPVRDYTGKILGYIEEDKDGNQRCRAFTGRVLGYYDKASDTTRDFYGKVITKGNSCMGFLYQDMK